MSRKAYRRIKLELADDYSFGLWGDDLLNFFEMNDGYDDYTAYSGVIEITVNLLEEAVKYFNWKKDDYRLEAIKKDIAWAKENNKDFVIYDCF